MLLLELNIHKIVSYFFAEDVGHTLLDIFNIHTQNDLLDKDIENN